MTAFVRPQAALGLDVKIQARLTPEPVSSSSNNIQDQCLIITYGVREKGCVAGNTVPNPYLIPTWLPNSSPLNPHVFLLWLGVKVVDGCFLVFFTGGICWRSVCAVWCVYVFFCVTVVFIRVGCVISLLPFHCCKWLRTHLIIEWCSWVPNVSTFTISL